MFRKSKPEIDEVRRWGRILTGLDAVISWASPNVRYYRYYPQFKPALEAIYLDNGAGDHCWGVFGPEGAIFKVFDHESELSPYAREEESPWPGIYADVPGELLAYLDHPEIERDDVTLCVYRRPGGKWVETTLEDAPEDHDGGGWWLLTQIHPSAKDWLCWSEDYYGCEFPKKLVQQIYKDARITPEQAAALLAHQEAEGPPNLKKALKELATLGLT